MRVRTLGYAAAAGLASFLVAFVVVSEALLPYVEFSVLLGIPAGLVTGTFVSAFVLTQVGQEDSPTRRGLARALGTFGIALLVVFALALLLGMGAAISTMFAVVVGLLAGVATFVWNRQ